MAHIDDDSETAEETGQTTDKASKYFRFVPVDRNEREEVIRDEKYSDGYADELTFIHIGKCGGYTVADALAASPVVKERFKSVKRIHIRRPYYQKHARYLFVLRNPVDRLISAFNWRYRKVVEEKRHEFMFSGEDEVLQKYGSLNNLAENLFENGQLSLAVARDIEFITHFRQDIFYYLEPLLPLIRRGQIFAVFTQERLDADIERVLQVSSVARQNSNEQPDVTDKTVLSDEARHNLKVFFARDYACIEALDKIRPLGKTRLKTLLA